MKKHLILAVSFILFIGSLAIAQDKTGIGFEYGGGYLMPMNDYEMRAVQSFALKMDLTDNLSASIFRAKGQIRGENSYTGEDDGSTGAVEDMDFTLVNTGDLSITGLRFKQALPLPIPVPLKAGLEIGTARFSNGAHNYRATGSTGTPVAGVGVNSWTSTDTLNGSYPVLGITVEAELFSQDTETLTVSAGVGASYRLISLPDLYALGEEKASFASPDDREEIDPVKNFNSMAITVGLNIGF